MKIWSQFSPEYLDGRKSFIFSWDKQHRIIHEDALVHFLNKTNEGQVFQPVTKIEPLQKEAENIKVEPEETFPLVGESSKTSNYEATIKESTVVHVEVKEVEEEQDKTHLPQEVSGRSSPRPNRRVLIISFGLQDADADNNVIKCFTEVSNKLGFTAEFSFSPDPQILETKDRKEYIILLVERNVFEREKNDVKRLVKLAEKKSGKT